MFIFHISAKDEALTSVCITHVAISLLALINTLHVSLTVLSIDTLLVV